jgi:hypothetical protein
MQGGRTGTPIGRLAFPGSNACSSRLADKNFLLVEFLRHDCGEKDFLIFRWNSEPCKISITRIPSTPRF